MYKDRFAGDPVAIRLINRLYADVGAFFCNTRRGAPQTCPICTGPTNSTNSSTLCNQCRAARNDHGGALADLVVPLAYAKARMPSMHQSAHHVREYKAPSPAPRCAQDLQLMAGAATYLHGRCIAAAVGAWQAVTFVPSTTRPGGSPPIAGIARRVHSVYPADAKVGLVVGPGADAPRSAPRPDRFTVPDEYLPQVVGRHVLVVEDTWVSGDKAQSAALALKAAGATCVTILCVTRWLRYDWDDHRELIGRLTEPYDAAHCPVTGSACPPD
jgi:hypothetical protein